MRLRSLPSLFIAVMLITSCGQSGKGTKGTGPIVLGDPATIVTEADSQYLQDMVMDIQPVKVDEPILDDNDRIPDTAIINAQSRQRQENEAVANKDKEQAAPAVEKTEKEEAPKGNGLTIHQSEFDLFIPNVSARGSGTSYMLTKGNIVGNKLQVTKGTITRISQRYQTVIVAKSSFGRLILDNLSKLADWKTIKGNGNTYTISGLEDRNLQAAKVTQQTIRNAVRRERLSKSAEQKWLSALRNVRSAKQKPLSVELRTVMWKIDGKDSRGRNFSKQIRIDLPI